MLISRRQGRQFWGLEVATPTDFGQGVVVVAGGSWTGREILLYLIMYRKYNREW